MVPYRIESRIDNDGKTVQMLKNPPLIAGHRYRVEHLRKGTFTATCVGTQNGHVTFNLDSGERLVMARNGHCYQDITEDEPGPTDPPAERTIRLHEGPGY